MKTYVFVDELSGTVNVSELEETHPEVQEGQTFLELAEDQSRLALRYGVQDGAIIDRYVGKSDAEVLEAILTQQKQAAVDAGMGALAVAKKTKLKMIRDHFNGIVETIKADVAPYEVATWDVQRIEYADWLQDKAAQIPYVTSLAAGRGISVELLMEKIGYRVAALARLQGMQQALETKVTDAMTIEAVEAIELPV